MWDRVIVWRLCKNRASARTEAERRDTDLDVGALGLHQFADHFAQLVGIGELPQGGGRREGRIRAGGRGHALGGIHLMEAATEGGDLLRALQKVRGGREEKRKRGGGESLRENVQLWTVARCGGKGPGYRSACCTSKISPQVSRVSHS